MKECFVSKRFGAASQRIIDQANAIIDEYASRGFDLTLRQLYYQFIARGLIPNQQRAYKRLGAIVNDARLAGDRDIRDRLELFGCGVEVDENYSLGNNRPSFWEAYKEVRPDKHNHRAQGTGLVRQHVERFIDDESWKAAEDREGVDRRHLTLAASRWEDVSTFLANGS